MILILHPCWRMAPLKNASKPIYRSTLNYQWYKFHTHCAESECGPVANAKMQQCWWFNYYKDSKSWEKHSDGFPGRDTMQQKPTFNLSHDLLICLTCPFSKELPHCIIIMWRNNPIIWQLQCTDVGICNTYVQYTKCAPQQLSVMCPIWVTALNTLPYNLTMAWSANASIVDYTDMAITTISHPVGYLPFGEILLRESVIHSMLS